MWYAVFQFIVGLVALILGAEWFVKGAATLAKALRISPLIIGLTVVAFGTSAPELAVTINSCFQDEPELAVGNIVGSNVANVLLILGLAAVAAPLIVRRRLIREDVPVMIGAFVLMWLLSLDGVISFLDGAILFACLIVYLLWMVRQARREPHILPDEFAQDLENKTDPVPTTTESVWWQFVLIGIGGALLVFGSDWLVESATVFAVALGASTTLIGLTIVAIGTSLPEIATSVVASLRGQRDIAVGNAIGSNIFNVFCVMGITAMVSPVLIPVEPALLWFDMPFMIIVAVACLPIFFTGYTIWRWEGAMFLAYYVGYLVYLGLDATQHAVRETYWQALVFFFLPLTSVTLIILAGKQAVIHGVAHPQGESPNPPEDDLS